MLPYFDFDMDKVVEYAHRRNPKLEIFPVSAKTGEGMDAWCDWLRKAGKGLAVLREIYKTTLWRSHRVVFSLSKN